MQNGTPQKRLVAAVTGASGMPVALALLRALAGVPSVEVHLIVSGAARRVLKEESGLEPDALFSLAHASYDPADLGAPPASGSWRHHGMIVCPCSMSSLAHIARGTGVNLVHRAADVALKERRPLVLAAREAPLSAVHLENMLAATRAGATIFPLCPAFYHRPATLDELLAHTAGRLLDCLDIPHNLCRPWGE